MDPFVRVSALPASAFWQQTSPAVHKLSARPWKRRQGSHPSVFLLISRFSKCFVWKRMKAIGLFVPHPYYFSASHYHRWEWLTCNRLKFQEREVVKDCFLKVLFAHSSPGKRIKKKKDWSGSWWLSLPVVFVNLCFLWWTVELAQVWITGRGTYDKDCGLCLFNISRWDWNETVNILTISIASAANRD